MERQAGPTVLDQRTRWLPECDGAEPEVDRQDAHATAPHATTVGEGPSWLAAPISTGRTDPALDRQSPTERDSLVSRSEAPTAEQPVLSTGSEAMITCSNCGSREFANSAFCTQCGTRLKPS